MAVGMGADVTILDRSFPRLRQLDTEFDGINIDNVEDDFSVGLNFGIGLNFNKIGVDLRYERGFSNNEATFIGNNIGEGVVSRIDTRPDQLILSLSIAL